MIRASYESDAGKRKQVPPEAYETIPHMPFEEYSERCKHFPKMKRENGILKAPLHTNGDSMQWGAPAPQGLHYFLGWAGRDPDNQIIILADFERYEAAAKRAARIQDGAKHPILDQLPEFPPKL
jgi:hypothetical protein